MKGEITYRVGVFFMTQQFRACYLSAAGFDFGVRFFLLKISTPVWDGTCDNI